MTDPRCYPRLNPRGFSFFTNSVDTMDFIGITNILCIQSVPKIFSYVFASPELQPKICLNRVGFDPTNASPPPSRFLPFHLANVRKQHVEVWRTLRHAKSNNRTGTLPRFRTHNREVDWAMIGGGLSLFPSCQ